MHFWENPKSKPIGAFIEAKDATTMDVYMCEGSASLTTKDEALGNFKRLTHSGKVRFTKDMKPVQKIWYGSKDIGT
jgi:hypothetical protein